MMVREAARRRRQTPASCCFPAIRRPMARKSSGTRGAATRGTVIVCPGRTEFIEKYFEVARDLQSRGFVVAVLDWPGQGLSQRMHRNPLAGHVRTYGAYVDALVRGLDALGRRAPKPHVILAHSMGATIALEALRTKRISVAAAAFSAPMWGLKIPFYLRWFARIVRWLGMGGTPARKPGPDEVFDGNLLTHDEPRWRVYRDLIAAEPKLQVGEPTIGWVVASLNVIRAFFWTGALDHLRDMPMLVAIAEDEDVVHAAMSRRVAKRLRSAKIITVKGARHEILMETDERREVFWKAFDEMCKRERI
jgi:lysophospholipase